MESLTKRAEKFVNPNFGYSSGRGFGNGFGDGSGYGSGDGFGSGRGSGDDFGDGFGCDFGYLTHIRSLNGERVWNVDGVPTIIRQVSHGIVKGAIVQEDLSLVPCFVVKQGRVFAHGETLREAMNSLRDKLFEDMPEEERITAFLAEHKPDVLYPNRDLYEWHHRLTGSCEMGRKEFMKAHGLDMDGAITVEEFIRLTRNAYGGDVIRRLEKRLEVVEQM